MGGKNSKAKVFWTMKDGVQSELDSTSHQFIIDVARSQLSSTELIAATKKDLEDGRFA